MEEKDQEYVTFIGGEMDGKILFLPRCWTEYKHPKAIEWTSPCLATGIPVKDYGEIEYYRNRVYVQNVVSFSEMHLEE
jgi:hypothetical protein